MSLSESFEPESLSHRFKSEYPWFSSDSVPSASSEAPSETTEVSPPYLHWQEHLLPLSCTTQEDNLTVLRLELETAHQLLQYQQTVIDTLSEQLSNRNLTLQHSQDELSKAQQACQEQASQLVEFDTICRDLKMQLRRQQQRVLQYRNLLKTEQTRDVTTSATPRLTDSMVTFGHHSSTSESDTPAKVQKSPPVSAWSAPDSIDLTGPLACYRELATIRMTKARLRLESTLLGGGQPLTSSAPFSPSNPTPEHTKPQKLEPASSARVELPSFTRTLSS